MRGLNNEAGFILVLGLLSLLFVSVIGLGAINTTYYHSQISGHRRVSTRAFYAAEAGINELLGRFRQGAAGEINDAAPSNPAWKLFVASNSTAAGGIGYSAGDPSHVLVQSLQDQLDFAVEVRHKVNIANSVIEKRGSPIYIVTSHGYTEEGGGKVVEVELVKSPSADPPGALYSERPVNVLGTSTYIQGNDACGSKNKPGITTTLPPELNPGDPTSDPISVSGHPTIEGDPAKEYNAEDQDLQETVNVLSKSADPAYKYDTNKTITGQSWGTPMGSGTTTPLTYSGTMNIVYFDMNGDKTVKLAGGCSGAGILLVNGNLELNGGFRWYGLIIVTGSVDYTGGGEKNVTGGIMAGETTTVQVDVGGNAGIIYCSSIADRLKDKINPFNVIRWRDVS